MVRGVSIYDESLLREGATKAESEQKGRSTEPRLPSAATGAGSGTALIARGYNGGRTVERNMPFCETNPNCLMYQTGDKFLWENRMRRKHVKGQFGFVFIGRGIKAVLAQPQYWFARWEDLVYKSFPARVPSRS